MKLDTLDQYDLHHQSIMADIETALGAAFLPLPPLPPTLESLGYQSVTEYIAAGGSVTILAPSARASNDQVNVMLRSYRKDA